MSKVCLVIPCYNEESRLPAGEYSAFIKTHPDVVLCFVNDGSKDNTLQTIEKISSSNPSSVLVVSKDKNTGKAEAVRTGIHYCLNKTNAAYIGFCDADLSTPLEDVADLQRYMNEQIEFCFGSRILKIGSVIERSTKRHYTGRIIATFISNILGIKVYDTQCGCKLFTRNISSYLFNEPFLSRWLFDVELFARMLNKYGKQQALTKMLEIPLTTWINKEDSKVKATYFFRLWVDLLRIKKTLKQ